MQLRNIVLSITALSLAGVASTASADTWRFGLEETEGSVQYGYAEEFKKLIEEKSDGDIQVELLPYGSWGSSYSALYDAIQNGAIPIGFGSGFLGGTVPESQLMSLNFVMPNDQLETAKILNSDDFLQSDAWQESFRERGLVPLATLPEGYQVWTANKEIRTPEDMQGLQIRVMDNSLLRATYEAYGASPITIAYGELYSALQQGQAEGNIQPVFAHENMGFYEVQDYMIFADQSQFIANLIGNEEWYEGLSDEEQQILTSTLDEMVQKGHDIQTQFNSERLETIKEKSDINIIHLNEEERAAFRELAKPVRQTYVDMVGERGQEALDIVLKHVGQSSDKAE
ncbi:TRAP-type C4-dicarboxylate transport system substrate-binding protein [Chromohalobacter marismortui]|uniref:TRAP-type C4-dicarboxylate transport system substrate-binding protein n=1 Tax=Chromohalobacter marismortui TaxID=42055 RepID=A0A4R7ND90_9GAMM|nr:MULTISPECIES: TRAP transporter substrate-binding protein DctP [Chromohalobacter]MCI0509918.1 TRAP transporter substrate-binding protein DctP [Chromohalobacter sp.]MCI0592069.1 TRAP transporter substrate-binding protein DctP [Chromohalobacter sp.]TDU18207.1 TRAP-type C4-dicarboxylate transport system substrate-binding protein [Chromohalobacter marismortui]